MMHLPELRVTFDGHVWSSQFVGHIAADSQFIGSLLARAADDPVPVAGSNWQRGGLDLDGHGRCRRAHRKLPGPARLFVQGICNLSQTRRKSAVLGLTRLVVVGQNNDVHARVHEPRRIALKVL